MSKCWCASFVAVFISGVNLCSSHHAHKFCNNVFDIGKPVFKISTMVVWEICRFSWMTLCLPNCKFHWLAFQTVAGHSCPFHHCPLIFLPINSQYLPPQYLHHSKPIITGELQWEFHLCFKNSISSCRLMHFDTFEKKSFSLNQIQCKPLYLPSCTTWHRKA